MRAREDEISRELEDETSLTVRVRSRRHSEGSLPVTDRLNRWAATRKVSRCWAPRPRLAPLAAKPRLDRGSLMNLREQPNCPGGPSAQARRMGSAPPLGCYLHFPWVDLETAASRGAVLLRYRRSFLKGDSRKGQSCPVLRRNSVRRL